MTPVTDLAALEALYGVPADVPLKKVATRLTPAYRRWIERSRFCVLSTIGPEGTDGSPRGDDGPVVAILDGRTLLLPDWRGNNRIDSLRNIVRDGRLSLLFLVAGSTTTMRVNGTGVLTTDPAMLARFDRGGVPPRSVIVVTIAEVYPQCGKALMRSGLWTSGDQSEGLPTLGEMITDVTNGTFDGEGFDNDWPQIAASTMW